MIQVLSFSLFFQPVGTTMFFSSQYNRKWLHLFFSGYMHGRKQNSQPAVLPSVCPAAKTMMMFLLRLLTLLVLLLLVLLLLLLLLLRLISHN
jgi:hypothetical protein